MAAKDRASTDAVVADGDGGSSDGAEHAAKRTRLQQTLARDRGIALGRSDMSESFRNAGPSVPTEQHNGAHADSPASTDRSPDTNGVSKAAFEGNRKERIAYGDGMASSPNTRMSVLSRQRRTATIDGASADVGVCVAEDSKQQRSPGTLCARRRLTDGGSVTPPRPADDSTPAANAQSGMTASQTASPVSTKDEGSAAADRLSGARTRSTPQAVRSSPSRRSHAGAAAVVDCTVVDDARPTHALALSSTKEDPDADKALQEMSTRAATATELDDCFSSRFPKRTSNRLAVSRNDQGDMQSMLNGHTDGADTGSASNRATRRTDRTRLRELRSAEAATEVERRRMHDTPSRAQDGDRSLDASTDGGESDAVNGKPTDKDDPSQQSSSKNPRGLEGVRCSTSTAAVSTGGAPSEASRRESVPSLSYTLTASWREDIQQELYGVCVSAHHLGRTPDTLLFATCGGPRCELIAWCWRCRCFRIVTYTSGRLCGGRVTLYECGPDGHYNALMAFHDRSKPTPEVFFTAAFGCETSGARQPILAAGGETGVIRVIRIGTTLSDWVCRPVRSPSSGAATDAASRSAVARGPLPGRE